MISMTVKIVSFQRKAVVRINRSAGGEKWNTRTGKKQGGRRDAGGGSDDFYSCHKSSNRAFLTPCPSLQHIGTQWSDRRFCVSTALIVFVCCRCTVRSAAFVCTQNDNNKKMLWQTKRSVYAKACTRNKRGTHIRVLGAHSLIFKVFFRGRYAPAQLRHLQK